ncbi:hypothetical protein P4639_14250 [Priestia megaterium]|uniref:hypothetical protein n=1 Tax=Priestia megaterium TaxID=1404 RepID=UPI002E224211|nr:hypothetical protein [Priestia megaterium]
MDPLKKLKYDLKTKEDNLVHMEEKIQFYREHMPQVAEEIEKLKEVIEVVEKHYAEKK